MGWVYLDDHFDEHHKVLGAGEIHPLAPWLFICGLTYSRRAAAGGLIPNAKVKTLTPLYRKAAREALITVGLWEDIPTVASIQVHDYGQWNKTNDERSSSARQRCSDPLVEGKGHSTKGRHMMRFAMPTQCPRICDRIDSAYAQRCPVPLPLPKTIITPVTYLSWLGVTRDR